MTDFLKGNTPAAIYQQLLSVGGSADHVGLTSALKPLFTDDGAGGSNASALKLSTVALRLESSNQLRFRDDAIYISSSGDTILNLVADGEIDLASASIDLNSTTSLTIDNTNTSNGVVINAATSGSPISIGHSTSETTINDNLTVTGATSHTGVVTIASGVKMQFVDSNEFVSGNSTDLTLGASADINLTASTDINIPINVGLTFGDDGEKIEGDGTDLTITGNTINLTATTDVALAVNTGLLLAGTEKIESDGTDLSITVGGGGDINIGSAIGVTFGDDGEKIEGDGTDLTIASSNLLNLTATTDIVIPTNVGLHFTDSAEKIESDGTDFTLNSGNDINLTATTDINVPSNVGMTFGDDGEKIEGDGTDLTISGNTVNLDSSMNHTFSSTGKAMVLGF